MFFVLANSRRIVRQSVSTVRQYPLATGSTDSAGKAVPSQRRRGLNPGSLPNTNRCTPPSAEIPTGIRVRFGYPLTQIVILFSLGRGCSIAQNPRLYTAMKPQTMVLLIAAASFSLCAYSAFADDRVVIGQPSVFWHNGQWQTWKDGVWTPYGQAVKKATEPAMLTAPNQLREHRTDAGVMRPQVRSGSNLRAHRQPGLGSGASIGGQRPAGDNAARPTAGIAQNPIAIGPNNLGIGQPNGIGQPTIGIGQPNIGIGQTTIGIGQSTIGIGQPNIRLG